MISEKSNKVCLLLIIFEIKNISDKPVVVENASASCGCTVPEKPEKPIARCNS